ncbi:MAG TPA: response regulator [Archangium sp.]|uniref:response regulator n=1 Tax=Archangium sp. TaxID=1872627 RepID=UPI002E32AC88|nr:response regulator [Archangium sp.]HEX5750625.1 response regulator [Archangium sp.]
MSSPAPSLPLRWHLVRLAAGTLLPAVVFAAVVVFQLARMERQDAERRVIRSARVLATAFEREMSGSIRTLQALAELLDMSGYEVAVAHDCPQALQQADTFRPDVALLDIGLPEVDGYGVAERIRERLGESSPVFAALTGFSQDGDRTRSQSAGFRQHFVKPIDIDELIAFIESPRPARSGAA